MFSFPSKYILLKRGKYSYSSMYDTSFVTNSNFRKSIMSIALCKNCCKIQDLAPQISIKLYSL